MARLLGYINDLEAGVRIPVGVPPEVQELEDAVAIAAGKKGRGGQGLRLNAAQRMAIEMHAMELARIELERRGCLSIRDTNKGNPIDYQRRVEGRATFVEVKGTVSSGEILILARGEVDLHREKYLNNMLIIVNGIRLGGESCNEATGGKIKVTNPLSIAQDSRSVVAYNYRTA